MSGLREAKKAASRAALAEAAAEIALRSGTDGLTVAAIAEAAGVSTRTFHNYFGSREEAVIHYVAGVVDGLAARFEDLTDGLPLIDALEAVVTGSANTTVAERLGQETVSEFVALARLSQLVEGMCAGDPILGRLNSRLDRLYDRYPGMDRFDVFLQFNLAISAIALTWQRREDELAAGQQMPSFTEMLGRTFDVLRHGVAGRG